VPQDEPDVRQPVLLDRRRIVRCQPSQRKTETGQVALLTVSMERIHRASSMVRGTGLRSSRQHSIPTFQRHRLGLFGMLVHENDVPANRFGIDGEHDGVSWGVARSTVGIGDAGSFVGATATWRRFGESVNSVVASAFATLNKIRLDDLGMKIRQSTIRPARSLRVASTAATRRLVSVQHSKLDPQPCGSLVIGSADRLAGRCLRSQSGPPSIPGLLNDGGRPWSRPGPRASGGSPRH